MEIEWPAGIKKTKQREQVYNVLANTTEPVSATDIFRQMPEYALSTIYRILSAFEEHNMVVRSNLPGDETAVYELNRGNHTHYAMCLGCHELVPLKHCPFEHVDLQTQEDDFEITGHKIELYGYCRKCKKHEQ